MLGFLDAIMPPPWLTWGLCPSPVWGSRPRWTTKSWPSQTLCLLSLWSCSGNATCCNTTRETRNTYLGAMSEPCCISEPMVNHSEFMRLNWFSRISGSSLQGWGLSHSYGLNLGTHRDSPHASYARYGRTLSDIVWTVPLKRRNAFCSSLRRRRKQCLRNTFKWVAGTSSFHRCRAFLFQKETNYNLNELKKRNPTFNEWQK